MFLAHSIQPDTTVQDILDTYPHTVETFVRYGMACAGCTLSRFDTVAEAAAIYRLDLERLLADLRKGATSDCHSERSEEALVVAPGDASLRSA